MGKFKTSSSDQEYWMQFCEANGHFTNLSHLDVKDPSNTLPEISGSDYSADISILKDHLNDVSFKKLSGRYRQYKLRNAKRIKTISLHENTLQRLNAFALANNFSFDTYDELLELLIHPDDRAMSNFIHPSDMPGLAITPERQFAIVRNRLSLRPIIWQPIINKVDIAYRQGWLDCKYLDARKRTPKALEEYATDYILSVQVDDL